MFTFREYLLNEWVPPNNAYEKWAKNIREELMAQHNIPRSELRKLEGILKKAYTSNMGQEDAIANVVDYFQRHAVTQSMPDAEEASDMNYTEYSMRQGERGFPDRNR